MKLLRLLLTSALFSVSVSAFIVIKPKSIEEAGKTEIKVSVGGEKSTGNEDYQDAKIGAYVSFGNGIDSKHLIISSYKFKETKDVRNVNKGLLHYRYTSKFTKTIDSEYFIQDEFDEFTNEKNRFLIGYNKRLQLNIISKSTYLGTGFLYSKILPSNPDKDKEQEQIRMNIYLITSTKIAPKTVLSGLVFYQPSVYDIDTKESFNFDNFKVNSQVSVENKITDSISIEIGAQYTYNTNPFVGIEKEDFKTSFEINYKIPVE